MQLSLLSDELLCLVLLLGYLVSMFIMGWYACGVLAMSRLCI
jgi:hypothetical protein